MKTNFVIAPSAEALAERLPDYYVAEIDGERAQTLRQFYDHIAQVLDFPDYFGYNLDSLDELLNDLDWIEDEKIALFISQPELFISKERDPKKLSSLLNMLDATAEDWKWLADDETDVVTPKQLLIAFQDSPRARALLAEEGIAHTDVSDAESDAAA